MNIAPSIADRVFRNAKVYSVALDDTVTRAEAVAVAGGKIVYVGTDEGVQPFIGEKTEVTDCKGNTILPGFGDGHMHVSLSVNRYGGVRLYDLKEGPLHDPEYYIAEIQKRLKAYVAEHPDAKAVLGGGLDRAWFDGSLSGIVRPITRKDLDAAVSDRPVVIDSYCGHVCLFNSAALEKAGLLHTGIEQVPGGEIRIGEDGIPDGFVLETAAIYAVKGRFPESAWRPEDKHTAITLALADMAKEGITLCSDYLYNKDGYELLAGMAKNGELTARVSGSFTIYDKTADADLAYAIEHMHEYDVDDLMKTDAAKFFVDGIYALFEPFPPAACELMGWKEGYRGELLWDEDNFRKTAAAAQKAGFHLHAHAMGDRGGDIAADAFSYARKMEDKDGTKRNVIIHISFMKDETKRKMADAGLIANIQPLWEGLTRAGNASEETLLGEERFVSMYPSKSLMDKGVAVAFGTDFPVDPVNTFGLLQKSMTRLPLPSDSSYERCKHESAVNPAECTSLQQAVKAGTVNVAYELGLEQITGSIETGKSAELVLIDRDIEAVPAGRIYETKVLETLFKGKTVYRREN